MKIEGVPADGESFQSRFCSLVKLQTQIQHYLETYQTQNQRQLEVLTSNLAKLMPQLDINGKFLVDKVGTDDDNQGFVLVPSFPQPDLEHDALRTTVNSVSEEATPPVNEQEPDHTDRYSDENKNTYNGEIEEEIIEDILHPGLLEEEIMSNVELQPEQSVHLSDSSIPFVNIKGFAGMMKMETGQELKSCSTKIRDH
ncbi:uncharacterized protein LOC113329886 isoform X2 [Papaver somniferum]|uniref:uncharacterized protein LOC113329886 isoform X2 n=1 Tax=Papaver somniferum TaxID=3469 RepID=UPI000E6FD51E|nr:uncharacterized protein LOC113329886 isoform X2 [Papaver somniferum]